MAQGMPWTRRLWDIGSILALEELWEASTWQARRVLSATAVSWQQRELARLVGPDLGLGTRELRRELTEILRKGEIIDPSPGHRRLRHLIDHAQTNYLDRWVTGLRDGAKVKPERLARTVAAHLLDLGYTAPFLTSQWAALSRDGAGTDAILTRAAELAHTSPRIFEVLLVMDGIPNRPLAEKTDGWLNKTEVSTWLAARAHTTRGVRASGGFRASCPR
ncbi:hypothetical protein [Saccharopolyspora sp. NPDC002376]